MTQTCKLCRLEKELRHSHILPEFMYQNLYDPKPRRFYTVNVDLDDSTKSSKKIEQKGIREYLLCGDCEVLLSKYENYAAETIYSKNKANKAYLIDASKTDDNKYFLYRYEGFSYKEFRIFLLSIFWRILISENYSRLDTDEAIKEKMRIAILKEDPLDYDDFGCLIQVIRYNVQEIAKGFILEPYLTKDNEGLVLNQLIDGFMFSFRFESKNILEEKKTFFLKPDGSLKMLGRILFDDKVLFETVRKSYDYFDTIYK